MGTLGVEPRLAKPTRLQRAPLTASVYARVWLASTDSNRAPRDYESPALTAELEANVWLRGVDLNHRPTGYEPVKLTGLLYLA